MNSLSHRARFTPQTHSLRRRAGARVLLGALIAPLCFSFAGCSAVQRAQQIVAPRAQVKTPPAPSEEPTSGGEELAERKPEPAEKLELPNFQRAAPPKQLPPATPIDPKKLVHVSEPVQINIDSMPLSDLIVHALGGMLKVNLYIDEQVKNMKDPVTLRTGEPLPADRALEVVLGVLESKNLYLEQRADTLYIFRSRPGQQRPVDIRVGPEVPDSPADIIQVVVLKYARPTEIEPVLKDLYKTGVSIKIHPRENALILAGQAAAIRPLMELIEVFDVPYVVGKKAFIIRLVYWQPDEFAKQMAQILDGMGITVARSSRDPGVLFIPLRFLNSLLVLAPDDTSAKIVLDWKDRLDTAESAGTEEKAFTYIPLYAKARDIVESIRQVYGLATSQPQSQLEAQPVVRFPGQPPVSYMPYPVLTQPPPSAGQSSQAPQRTPGQPQPPGAGNAGASGGLKIAADERRNVVMLVTTPANYKSVLTLLRELDTPIKQVLMEATIAEVNLTDDLSLGFEFFIKQKVKDGTLDVSTLTQALSPLTLATPAGPGLHLQYIAAGEKLATVINALQKDSKANVISRPRLMVVDNQEATIQIGDDVPTISSQVSAPDIGTGTPSILQNVQYRSTGRILRIKPTINSKNLLTLEISLEVSQPSGAVLTPTISTRRIQTSVVAGDGQTVVLGGMISENSSGDRTKIPWLGDLPVVGYLFRSDNSNKRRTELILLISPRILASVEETTRVTEEVKQELHWFK